jgi:cysteine-rich repeat protein
MIGGMRRSLALSLLLVAGCFADGGDNDTATTTGGEGTTAVDVEPLVCGDGVVDEAEQCDAGPMNGADGSPCRAGCLKHKCGDGIVAVGLEECDDGPYNGGACTDTCTLPVCGDGMIAPGEGCDDGPMGSDTCTIACKLVTCGDGVVQPPEACDDGNDDQTDGCTPLCREAACGDGFVRAGVEQCDDGDLDPGDDCTDTCAWGTCGDGRLRRGVEQCDDGNSSDGDQCKPNCTLSQLFVFVSSVRYNGALGGLVGADARCQELAAKAGVQGIYRAWLSDGDAAPPTRFKHGLPYIRLDKMPVASSLDAMIEAGVIQNPIALTENNEPLSPADGCDVTDKVWTNLRRDAAPAGDLDCGAWTTSTGVAPKHGGLGVAHKTGQGWTDEGTCPLTCAAQLRLYCFQQMP